jgi:hypothetical protein
MTAEQEPDPVAAAAALTEEFAETNRQLARLQRSGKRDRRIVRALAASFALDLLITAGLWSTQYQGCTGSNAARHQDIAIWDRLLRVPPSVTASQKAEVKDLEALVRVKDKPRDCVKLYP